MTMGVIVGNRGVFPGELARAGREEIMRVLDAAGVDAVVLAPEQTKYGAVENHEEAKRCADLFRRNADRIDGVIVTLPNFGDERAVADTLRLANLDVPVLIQATPDVPGKMAVQHRRDSFCGKMSVCNNLRQHGIPYSLTREHTEAPESPEFAEDLQWFAAVCRVVGGMRNLRVGCIGARVAPFNTVRYSEKILEAAGISVETVDLSDILGRVGRLTDDDVGVSQKLAEIRAYVPGTAPDDALLKMAKLGYVIAEWMRSVDVSLTAVQCWSALQDFYGVASCTLMSMMSNNLMSSACEADICGTLSMHALALASETPSALLDWNNNYGRETDKAVCFHCSNLPKSFFEDPRMHYNELGALAAGSQANFQGTVVGRVKAGPMSYARVSTDDTEGMIRGYVGDGAFTADPLDTFGGVGVVQIPRLRELLRFICANGFEHHVAATRAHVAAAVHEATTCYLGWDIALHHA
jgi:L-fucose isomerase-like protein